MTEIYLQVICAQYHDMSTHQCSPPILASHCASTSLERSQDDEGLDLAANPQRAAQIAALQQRAEKKRVPLRVCDPCFAAAPAEMNLRQSQGVEGGE